MTKSKTVLFVDQNFHPPEEALGREKGKNN